MKTITIEQIEQILQAFYNTNISAKDFDAIKQFFKQLPEVEEKITKNEKNNK